MLRGLRKLLAPTAVEREDPDVARQQQQSPLLHPDILLHLFSELSAEKAVALASVCRAWRIAACEEPLLWRGLVDEHLIKAMSPPGPAQADPEEPSTSNAPMQQQHVPALGLSIPHLYLALYAR